MRTINTNKLLYIFLVIQSVMDTSYIILMMVVMLWLVALLVTEVTETLVKYTNVTVFGKT